MTVPFRLAAFDMDGTLLDSTKGLPPGSRAALAALREAGVRIMLASGRPVPGLRRLASLLELGEDLVLASMNGSIVHDLAADRQIAAHPIPADTARAVIRAAQRHGITTSVPHGAELLVEDVEHPRAQYEARGNDLRLRRVEDLSTIVDDPTLDGAPTKILFIGEPSEVAPLEEELRAEHGDAVELAWSSPLYLEATAAGVHKGRAILDFCESQGFGPEEVIAFGDQGNDVHMLRIAGLGVAMGNGTEEAKAAADEVTTSHDDEGIARVVERYLEVDLGLDAAAGS